MEKLTNDWRSEANCAGMNPEIFYVERLADAAEAFAVCAECPVKPECLEYALANGEVFGIWAGRMPSQRRRLRYEYRRDNRLTS